MTVTSERLRQFMLAAQPQIFFGFQFRHPEQMAEHFEPVAVRQPNQVGRGFRDEGSRFIRAALPPQVFIP